VNGGSEDAFDMGKEAFYLDGPWEGYENIPPDNPSLVGHFGVESFPTVPGGPKAPSTWVNGNYNVIPKGAKNPQAAFAFVAWLAGYDNVTTMSQILPTGGWVPTSPKVAAAPAYKTWLRKNPYLKPFITQFGSRYSRQTQLTPAEAVYDVALTDAAQYVATGKMKPMAALRYIDAQANAALAKA
jgi:multiple sugar transport system substrate-binding protein